MTQTLTRTIVAPNSKPTPFRRRRRTASPANAKARNRG